LIIGHLGSPELSFTGAAIIGFLSSPYLSFSAAAVIEACCVVILKLLIMADEVQELDEFERKLQRARGELTDSSEEEPEMIYNEKSRLQAKVNLLVSQLIEKDREIESLKDLLMKPEDEGDFGSQKVASLAKKCRVLQVSLESEKNRAARAMEEVNSLREEMKTLSENRGWQHKQQTQEDWRGKCKAMDEVIQASKLKQHRTSEELKKAMRILQREVGEFDSLDKLLAQESWRGRAQTIEKLKARLNELERQQRDRSERKEPEATNRTFVNEGSADERRKEIMSLKTQLEATNTELEEWRKKAKAFSSRKKALEDEVREVKDTCKQQVRVLLEKADNDDRLIKALKADCDKARRTQPHTSSAPPKPSSEVSSLKFQLSQQEDEVQRLRAELKEKEELMSVFQLHHLEDEEVPENEVELKRKISQLEQTIAGMRSEAKPKASSSSEDALMIKDLSSQNVRLRMKVSELQGELSQLRTR
jgi:chromosome segregation ATPase